MHERLNLSFDWTARAHVQASAPPQPGYHLLAYHGYAESASAPLDALLAAGFDDGVLLAPMAPHHFYNRQGQVVGSWMTRFERERRIEELVSHAEALWSLARERWGGLPLFVFGFSQGGANAYRVSLLSALPVRRCFILGGDQPPELKGLAPEAGSPAMTLMTGSKDDPGIREAMENDHRTLAERGYNVDRFSLQGGHEYLPQALSLMREQIRAEV